MSSSSLYSSSSSLSSSSSSTAVLGVWTIIALIVAIGGGIALYFTFLSKKNDGKFKGFLGWLYDTLSFKKLAVETLLKVTYLIIAIFMTLYSLGLIAVNIIAAIGVLVFGNLLVRIAYEFMLMRIITCRNTSDINTKVGSMAEPKAEEKTEVKIEE